MCQCLWAGQEWQTGFRNGTGYQRILQNLHIIELHGKPTTVRMNINIPVYIQQVFFSIQGSEHKRKCISVLEALYLVE